MKSNTLSLIRSSMGAMSKGQRRISEYILTHYEKAAYMTASKLGEAAGVSESTVVRFAGELGFEGYPEFQASLRESVRSMLTSVQRIEMTDEMIGDGDVLERTLSADMARIKMTVESNSPESFEAAIECISGAKNIYVAGARASSMLSDMLASNLNLIYANIHHVDSSSESSVLENLIRIGEGDLLIAITFPRYSKRIIKAVTFAKNRGARILGITDSMNSPIAAVSDYLLFAKSDMASFVDSLVAPLSLVNAIIVAISRRNKDELAATFDKLESVWAESEVYEKGTDNA